MPRTRTVSTSQRGRGARGGNPYSSTRQLSGGAAPRQDGAGRSQAGSSRRDRDRQSPDAPNERNHDSNDVLDEAAIDRIHTSILIYHRHLGMRDSWTTKAAFTLLRQLRELELGEDDEVNELTEAMVAGTMERYAALDRSNRLLAAVEGSTGIQSQVAAINTKLPAITPLLVMSDAIEARGKAYLRLSTTHAFLSTAVPAYSRHSSEITNMVLCLARNRPEELGTNGKHLLKASNSKGTQAVTAVINEKVNQLRFDMRELVYISMTPDLEQPLPDLTKAVLEGVEGIKPTWGLVQKIAIWRKTGYTEGCMRGASTSEWNKDFWAQVDARMERYNENIRKGEDGDEEAADAAVQYMDDLLDYDEATYGKADYPARDDRCEMQQQLSDIFVNGLPSNV